MESSHRQTQKGRWQAGISPDRHMVRKAGSLPRRFLSNSLLPDSAGVTGFGRARSGSGVARPQGAGTALEMAVFHRKKGGQQGD